MKRKQTFEEIETDALLQSVSNFLKRIFEQVAEISEMPSYQPNTLIVLNPMLRTWHLQMETVIEDLARIARHAAQAAPGPGTEAANVQLDAEF